MLIPKMYWAPRQARLLSGNQQFGCQIERDWLGRVYPHKHDAFCENPTEDELISAGINPREFKPQYREVVQEHA